VSHPGFLSEVFTCTPDCWQPGPQVLPLRQHRARGKRLCQMSPRSGQGDEVVQPHLSPQVEPEKGTCPYRRWISLNSIIQGYNTFTQVYMRMQVQSFICGDVFPRGYIQWSSSGYLHMGYPRPPHHCKDDHKGLCLL
jgi:hypothetical protein